MRNLKANRKICQGAEAVAGATRRREAPEDSGGGAKRSRSSQDNILPVLRESHDNIHRVPARVVKIFLIHCIFSKFVKLVYKLDFRNRSKMADRHTTYCVSSEASESSEFSENATFPEIRDYLSIRITLPHIDINSMLEKVFHSSLYILYPHKGSKTNKEHVHMLLPTYNDAKKIKDRLRLQGFKGNETFSCKVMHNNILSGIQYCAKEGTKPIIKGDFQHYVDTAPKWNFKPQDSIEGSFGVEEDRKERDWQLTYSNLVCQAVQYARRHKMTHCTLREVVKEMMKKTKWRPCHQMYRQGVDLSYEEDFEFRVGHRKDLEMDWWTCKRAF